MEKGYLSFEDFRNSIIDISKKMSYDEYYNKTNLHAAWERMPDEDCRKQHFKTKDNMIKFFYEFFIENVDNIIYQFYIRRIELKTLKNFKYNYTQPINGVIKNVPDNTRYFRSKFNQWMVSVEDHTARSVVNNIQNYYYDGIQKNCNLLPPSIFKDINFDDISNIPESFLATMRTESQLTSVFSQNVYRSLLVYSKTFSQIPVKKLLCPTASWGVPVVAAKYQDYELVTLVDVACEVLQQCHSVYKDFETNTLFDSDYELETICIPSEKMGEKLTHTYQQILFCPPYYNLEIYGMNSEQQSTSLYETYEEWLDKYWRGTCIECNKVLEEGGVFTFIISNFARGVYIADDMTHIAKDYFELVDTIRIETLKKNINFENEDRYEKALIFRKNHK